MPLWAPLALTATTAALLAVPVAPALLELRRRRDAAPLPTSRHDGRISNFAGSLQSRLKPLQPQLERCGLRNEISRTTGDGLDILLVGRDDFDFDADALQGIDVVMCRNPAFVPAGRKIEADIYSEGTLTIGEGAVVRAALAAGDVILGKNGTVQRWLHASGRVFLGEESTFYGRLSAEQSIHMERGCSFQRVQAPGIFTVERIQSNHSDNHPDLTLPRARELELVRSGERMRVRGNFALPAGETLHAHVIATGQLHVGCGAHLHGSAKSYRDTTINDNACVHGSVVSERAVRVGSHSYVAGPLIAEREVIIGSGAMAGTADALTTVSGRRVHLGMGCQVHGTIWARDHGTVEG